MALTGLSGLSWPWVNGVPDFIYDADVVEVAIKDLIFTSYGERKMNTDYGSDIMSLVFENKGDLLRALAVREISMVFSKNIPYARLLGIDVIQPEDDNEPVDIMVSYEYQGIRKISTVSVDE